MNSVRKLTFLLSVIFCLAVGQGCTKKENVYVPGSGGGGPTGPQNEVTGKGNGGNEMKMTFPEIEIKLAAVKPYLHRLFLGLKDLNVAEQLSPGLTDLKDFPELQNLIGLMTRETTEYMNVFGDIAVDNNFALKTLLVWTSRERRMRRLQGRGISVGKFVFPWADCRRPALKVLILPLM